MNRNVYNAFYAFCIFLCISITACNKNKNGETGPYPDLGKVWSAEVALTEDNGMPVKNPTWDLADISVTQHMSLGASDANIGGLKHCRLSSPDTETELDISYEELAHDSVFNITSSAAYTGSGVLVDENNITMDFAVDIVDPFFGNYSGRLLVNMTRLNPETWEVIDDQVGVDGTGSTSSALTSAGMDAEIDPLLLVTAELLIDQYDLPKGFPAMRNAVEMHYMKRAAELTP